MSESSHPAHSYVFEAKALQRYIFDTGRLHDMVAASALIDALCGGERSLLDAVSEQLPAEGRPRFSRRAGGALVAHFDSAEALQAFRALWTLVVQMGAPGLEFAEAEGHGASVAEATTAARRAAVASSGAQAVRLPVGGPLAERAGRTGRVASALSRKDGDAIDAITAAKRRAAERLFRQLETPRRHRVDPVARRLDIRLEDGQPALWPLNLDRAEQGGVEDEADRVQFPYGGGPPYVGVIHADGNGLGQMVMALGEAVADLPGEANIELFRRFSEGLDAATIEAVRRATRTVLVPRAVDGVLPARPFILGGDDLGMIVRGDCALEFAHAFIVAFEEETGRFIEQLAAVQPRLRAVEGLPPQLTAAAGIAYVKAHQPFFRAYELAESLCAHAKRVAKGRLEDGAIPSAVAFHRVTTSMLDDYGEVRSREILVQRGSGACELAMQPWFVGRFGRSMRRLEDLLELRACTREPLMSASRLREVLDATAAAEDGAAEVRYQRWRDVVGGRARAHLERFDDCLKRILGEGADVRATFLAQMSSGGPRVTPLGDLVALAALSKEEQA